MYSRLSIVASLLFILVFLPHKTFAAGPVVVNEVLVHPSAGNKEWVEFYVTDATDLETYWIDDDASFANDGGEFGSPKKSLETVVQGNENHYYIEMSGSMFNNAEDKVVLFKADGSIVDQIQYSDGPGYDVTFGRTPNATGGFYMLASATKGSANSGPQPTAAPTAIPTAKPTKTPAATSEPAQVQGASTVRSTAKRATPTKNLTPIPSPTKKLSPTPKVASTSAVKQASKSAFPTSVLGLNTTPQPTRIPLPSIPVKVQGASNTPALFTILGAGFIIACAVIVFIKKLRAHG